MIVVWFLAIFGAIVILFGEADILIKTYLQLEIPKNERTISMSLMAFDSLLWAIIATS